MESSQGNLTPLKRRASGELEVSAKRQKAGQQNIMQYMSPTKPGFDLDKAAQQLALDMDNDVQMSDEESVQTTSGSSENGASPGTRASSMSESDAVSIVDHPLPDIWADARQPLCAALPYFKSYQGGLHRGKDPETDKSYAKGMLVDAESRYRDVLGAQVIISTISGGREENESGHRIHMEDQKESSFVTCLQNSFNAKKPIFVIAGSNHPFYKNRVAPPALASGVQPYHAPLSLVNASHRYMVLGWFHVASVHREVYRRSTKDKFVKIWVVRLEKVELGTASWWYPKDRTAGDPYGYTQDGQVVALRKTCVTCDCTSPQVFEQGWTCMVHTCKDFFKFHAGIDLGQLKYAADYLRERSPFEGDLPLPQAAPALPANDYSDDNENNFGTEETFRQGMVCPKCGCCADRVYWDRWECPNKACGHRHYAALRQYPLTEVDKENKSLKSKIIRQNQRKDGFTKLDWQQVFKDQSITRVNMDLGAYDTATYILCDKDGKVIGTVTHFKGNMSIQQKQDGPNDLWRELQADDQLSHEEKKLNLKRNAVMRAGSSQEMLTRHFQQNFGAPYKFVVSVLSKAFEEAPDVILKALARMTWAGQAVTDSFDQFLGDRTRSACCPTSKSKEFNELLLLGYMEKDHISYHDDGEKELGPTVATLSLGSPSTFTVKPKKTAGIVTEKEARANKAGVVDTKPVLEIAVQHGDMIVMHGAGIHGQYLHKVDPHGKRRYALTCRYVNPQRMSSPAERAYAIEAGKIPERAAQFNYSGDIEDSVTAATST